MEKEKPGLDKTTIIVALITAVSAIIVAVISYVTSVTITLTPIQKTETAVAEARLTQAVPSSATPHALTSTGTPTFTRLPITATQIPIVTTPIVIVVTATPLPPTSTTTRAVVPTATFTPKPTDTPSPILGSTQISSVDGATMVYIPAGEFTMGSNNYGDEYPPHTVFLDAFWIDKVEVTTLSYKKCVVAGKCLPPNDVKSSTRELYYGSFAYDNYPVIYVSWNDANSYCQWAGRRLPTEAEWEKAARGDDNRIYSWGNRWDGTRLNFCDKNCSLSYKDNSVDDGHADTSPAGNYPSGASLYGALDMAGNVWEWVSDRYDANYYTISPRNNPKGSTSGVNRVLRGGSWESPRSYVHTADRHGGPPDSSGHHVGFRCAQNSGR